MNAFCPNLSNKKVKQEFDELTSLFGEDAAYFLWNKNNGYSLDKAPNGADSILFKSLLDNYNGDRQAALKAKAKVYTSNFTNWFGDWTKEDKTDVSKVVDENGEPLVVYHGGSNTKIFNTKGGQFGAGIKKGDIGTYFTPSKKSAEYYEAIYDYKIGEKWLTLKELADNGELSEEDIKSLDEAWENEKPNTRAFFLNIRNPKITNYIGDNTKGFNKEDYNIDENDDGQFININSSKPKEYVAFNSNQIKSATDNKGTFSDQNDSVYESKQDTVSQ
jgi:hypothetical protein